MKIKTFMLLTILIGTFSHNIKANYMDKVATCAGSVVGNAAIDYMLGDEKAFNDAIKVAYYALVPTVNGVSALVSFTDEERAFTDKITSANIDKVIIAYNNGNYDAALYEEIIGCYRMLAVVLMDPLTQLYLKDSKDVVDAKIENTIKNLKRLLDAA